MIACRRDVHPHATSRLATPDMIIGAAHTCHGVSIIGNTGTQSNIHIISFDLNPKQLFLHAY